MDSGDAPEVLEGFEAVVRCVGRSSAAAEVPMATAEFVEGSAPPMATKAMDDVADDAGDDAAAFGAADNAVGVIRRRGGQRRRRTKWRTTRWPSVQPCWSTGG